VRKNAFSAGRQVHDPICATRNGSRWGAEVVTEWKLVVAAGGTGGHISPALAIADHLVRIDAACRIEFVCGTRPVELEIYRKAGIAPKTLEIERLIPGWRGLLTNIFHLRRAMKTARACLRQEQPRVVLGMGGYVCVPVVAAATTQRIPTMIHEQNAAAGRANRWLSRRVKAIACAYPQAARSFPAAKTRVTGNPVRPEFLGGDREAALRHWELAPNLPTLLVSGGSQGARRLNQIVLDALPFLERAAAATGGLQILWSCGEQNLSDLKDRLQLKTQNSKLETERLGVRLVPFIREMGLAYAVADLAFCRAGAMTLAELTANGVPALLVPLPEAVANHQWLNGKPLADAGAAIVFKEPELDGRRFADRVIGLLSNRAELNQMREASRRLGRPDAVQKIAAMILELRGELP